MNLIIYKASTYEEVLHSPEYLYIFTDNLMRTSGTIPIEKNSWYYKKYGPKELNRPLLYSTAVMRGLPNAYPITLQKYCSIKGNYDAGAWKDSEYNLFKNTLDNDLSKIYHDLYKYSAIILPLGGLFNREHSKITLERTPKIYSYLKEQLDMLLYNRQSKV